MSGGIRLHVFAGTDVGRVREGNEDSYFTGDTVFAVADGMGGHQAGEVASQAAVKPLEDLDGRSFTSPEEATQALRQAIERANRDVVGQAQADPKLSGMGTTLTAVLVRDGELHLAHVGDSRAYLLRDGSGLSQLTTDHTLVEQLVQEGQLSRDEIATHPQRSVITRAIGVDVQVQVDTLAPQVLQPDDQVLLCSDGLTGPVDEDDIADILRTTDDGDEAVARLLEAANARGGPDNITVVLLRVTPDDGEAPAPRRVTTVAPATSAIPIRPDTGTGSRDWATDLGRLGDRQGVDRAAGRTPSGGRLRRMLGVLTGVAVLLAVLGVGSWLVLSRAFFVGERDGAVAIFNGLPEEVAGVPLYRLVETTDVAVADLSPLTQERIRGGFTVGSLEEARATVEEYRAEILRAQPEPTEEPTGDAGRDGTRRTRDRSP